MLKFPSTWVSLKGIGVSVCRPREDVGGSSSIEEQGAGVAMAIELL
jgi:hypothetical protein